VAARRRRAKDVYRLRSNGDIWVDHAEIFPEDHEWLSDARKLTLWNVKVPCGFLPRLERLWWLDVRGGAASSLDFAQGLRNVRYLAINQVRGLACLSAISEMYTLRYLALYGLPQIAKLPSCSPLVELEHVSLGSMRGLCSLRGVLDAPNLRELQFIRKVAVNDEDVEVIATHPTLEKFGWFAEDVPAKDVLPVVTRIALPPCVPVSAAEWFTQRNQGAT